MSVTSFERTVKLQFPRGELRRQLRGCEILVVFVQVGPAPLVPPEDDEWLADDPFAPAPLPTTTTLGFVISHTEQPFSAEWQLVKTTDHPPTDAEIGFSCLNCSEYSKHDFFEHVLGNFDHRMSCSFYKLVTAGSVLPVFRIDRQRARKLFADKPGGGDFPFWDGLPDHIAQEAFLKSLDLLNTLCFVEARARRRTPLNN
jgi:hypothetical protein